jgi:hypothetical protein
MHLDHGFLHQNDFYPITVKLHHLHSYMNATVIFHFSKIQSEQRKWLNIRHMLGFQIQKIQLLYYFCVGPYVAIVSPEQHGEIVQYLIPISLFSFKCFHDDAMPPILRPMTSWKDISKLFSTLMRI